MPSDNLQFGTRRHELLCNRLCMLKMWSLVETGEGKEGELDWLRV